MCRRVGRAGLAWIAWLCEEVGVLAQPIAGTFDLYDDRMVKQPIKQRSGDDGITKKLRPTRQIHDWTSESLRPSRSGR